MSCWRLLGTTGSSSHTASSSSKAASGSDTLAGSTAAAGSDLSAQLSECWETFLQQVLHTVRVTARSMLEAPLQAEELTAAAAGSTQQACNTPCVTADSSNSSSGSSSGSSSSSGSRSSYSGCPEPGHAAAVLCAWSVRLDVVWELVYLLNSAAEQHQHQHQPPPPRQHQQQALRSTVAEVVQLLQQQLRTVLLPLLFSPTAELPAIGAGGVVWGALCRLLWHLCVTDSHTTAEQGYKPRSLLLQPNLGATASSRDHHHHQQQQQQLFGLLLSVSNAAVHVSQLPCAQVVLPGQPAPCSMLHALPWTHSTVSFPAGTIQSR
jgi:hypothetical protein